MSSKQVRCLTEDVLESRTLLRACGLYEEGAMGMSIEQRKAATRQMARHYERASKKEKGRVLDELCALTWWTRRYAIRALADAIPPSDRPPRPPRTRVYGPENWKPLRTVWATLKGPAGKHLAPFMAEIVGGSN
jgi:hypothetical protein